MYTDTLGDLLILGVLHALVLIPLEEADTLRLVSEEVVSHGKVESVQHAVIAITFNLLEEERFNKEFFRLVLL